jgi:hypothetical protein
VIMMLKDLTDTYEKILHGVLTSILKDI